MEQNKYIDIHTHTYAPADDTIVLLNVFPGDDAVTLNEAYKSIGEHPWHINEERWPMAKKAIEKAMNNNTVIAIGETGLDKKTNTDFKLQTKVFLEHLSIAETYRRPVVIHCVKAYSEILAIRNKSDQSIPWIFHWFNSDENMAREIIRKNGYVSFGIMLFKEESKAFRTFNKLPPDHIFLETDDAGYSIAEVYDRAAFLRNCDIKSLQKQIIGNFARCFHL